MTDRELLAIMSAIIFAGADSATEQAGYYPSGAVANALKILACVDSPVQINEGPLESKDTQEKQ